MSQTKARQSSAANTTDSLHAARTGRTDSSVMSGARRPGGHTAAKAGMTQGATETVPGIETMRGHEMQAVMDIGTAGTAVEMTGHTRQQGTVGTASVIGGVTNMVQLDGRVADTQTRHLGTSDKSYVYGVGQYSSAVHKGMCDCVDSVDPLCLLLFLCLSCTPSHC